MFMLHGLQIRKIWSWSDMIKSTSSFHSCCQCKMCNVGVTAYWDECIKKNIKANVSVFLSQVKNLPNKCKRRKYREKFCSTKKTHKKTKPKPNDNVGENALLIPEVRGKRPNWFELKKGNNNSSRKCDVTTDWFLKLKVASTKEVGYVWQLGYIKAVMLFTRQN